MIIRLAFLVICFFTLLPSSTVNGAASTWPAPIPLFHKSPYFNAWIDASSNVSNSPVPRWPEFFHPNQRDLAWFIGIRVDNISYVIQGRKDEFSVNYTEGATVSTYIMPTQTRFSIAAGPVSVNLTYLTPIELQDWTLHSFPFAYIAFDIISLDGSPHAIQLYTDATGRVVSSVDSNIIAWSTSVTGKSIYHMVQQSSSQPLTENNDMSEDGSLIWAYTAIPGVSMTWQTSGIGTSRGNFSLHGKLENTSDINFRAINNQWPVLAYALDLGNISKTSNTLVIGIGLIRDPVVSYRTTAKTTQSLSHLWYSKWGSILSATEDFLTSYSSASSRANDLDNRIQLNASALASRLGMSTSTATKFVDLHVLNLRQTVGSLEFTTSSPRNRVDMDDDVRVFMKDVGYSRRTNPVEILYASFPAFLFLNTTLAGKLLEPLLEFQDSSLYRNDYAAPDLGDTWPIIQGNATDQSLFAIDSCSAMLIMTLAHARKSGNGKLLYNYYNLLRKWADYLVQSTRRPGSYMSSDGLYSSNANLALKGIMGLYAMGKINSILEIRGADASKTPYYLNIANNYAQDWLREAVSLDHVMASYGSNSTWAMVYNLFAPRLLGAAIIPEQLYEIQSLWYASRSGRASTFGLPYDSTQSLTKAHWTLLSASSVLNATSSAGRDGLISLVHSRAFWQSGMSPNPATYSPIDGTLAAGSASPAMGAVYSFLALNLPDLPVTIPSGSLKVGNSRSTANVRVIVGATFGALGGLLFLVTIVLFLQRTCRPKLVHSEGTSEELRQRQQLPNITPFTDEIRPPVTTGVQEQNDAYLVDNANIKMPPRAVYAEKFAMILSPDSVHQTTTATDKSVVGGSPVDDNLRWEVEQLRGEVEKLVTPILDQRSMGQEANVAIRLLDSVAPLLGLVPVPGLQVVWKGFKALWDLVQQVHDGRSQLEVLLGSIAVFLRALDQKLHDNESLAASIEENLESLLSLVEEISEFARKQASKPFLKRLLQGDEVTATVTKYHQRLLHVYNVFNLSCELDIKLWQSQFGDARRHDQEILERLLQELMKNQDLLFKELFGKIDVQQTSILAAMSAMQKASLFFFPTPKITFPHVFKSIIKLNTHSNRSTERDFLQHSVALLQHRSGHVVPTESWTVSSFEVDKGEKLGGGGFSNVYKATYLGAPVAVKELAPTTSSKMLMNEIAVWEGLRHPNILQFMGASVYENPPFIIMELMIKGNALDFIRGKPTANRVLLIHQISLGLVYLHTRNTIHGDLKATNVLIKADETAVIADFGLSMIKFDITSRSTAALLVSGTKRWMSPERMKGKPLATPVDIYAWAMTAYEIFTGLVPFGPMDESLLDELVLREGERPERPEDCKAAEVGLTDAIWSLMERSWASNPYQRPSASDVRDETVQFI